MGPLRKRCVANEARHGDDVAKFSLAHSAPLRRLAQNLFFRRGLFEKWRLQEVPSARCIDSYTRGDKRDCQNNAEETSVDHWSHLAAEVCPGEFGRLGLVYAFVPVRITLRLTRAERATIPPSEGTRRHAGAGRRASGAAGGYTARRTRPPRRRRRRPTTPMGESPQAGARRTRRRVLSAQRRRTVARAESCTARATSHHQRRQQHRATSAPRVLSQRESARCARLPPAVEPPRVQREKRVRRRPYNVPNEPRASATGSHRTSGRVGSIWRLDAEDQTVERIFRMNTHGIDAPDINSAFPRPISSNPFAL